MKKLKLFDYTTNFCEEKEDFRSEPSFQKTYSKFMINKVLSMSPKTCHLAMFMSQRPDIPKEQHFAFYNFELDKDRIFFNYAKKGDEVSAAELLYIQEYFVCSMERALEYIEMMSQMQFETIIELFLIRDKKIEKGKSKKKK